MGTIWQQQVDLKMMQIKCFESQIKTLTVSAWVASFEVFTWLYLLSYPNLCTPWNEWQSSHTIISACLPPQLGVVIKCVDDLMTIECDYLAERTLVYRRGNSAVSLAGCRDG